jgi:peptide/nickel transport system substrate-binding protein
MNVAIDRAEVIQGIFGGLADPAPIPLGLSWAFKDVGFKPTQEMHYTYDPARAKKLLAEAGLPDGFELGLTCPNNRYVNDERICTALAAMFAKVGVRVKLDAMPRAQFFQKVDQFDISMHLYGWGGAARDPGFTLTPVLHSRDGKGKGDFNSGRYKDEELDRLIDAIEVELDPAKRRAMMLDALKRVRDNVYVIPLHRQLIPWAVRKGVPAAHRPDNGVEALWTRVGGTAQAAR